MKNIKRYTMGLAGVALMLGLTSCGSGGNKSGEKDTTTATVTASVTEKEPRTDEKFVLAAADGGMYEVELGKLASSKGTLADVQQLGRTMVTDHTKLNTQLKLLAQQRNINLPDQLSHKSQEKYDQLSKKTGAEFDEEYASEMVAAHQEDIDAFKKEAESGKDSDIKSWAEGEIPLLEHHLEIANFTLHPEKGK